jgi:hypothetical protein
MTRLLMYRGARDDLTFEVSGRNTNPIYTLRFIALEIECMVSENHLAGAIDATLVFVLQQTEMQGMARAQWRNGEERVGDEGDSQSGAVSADPSDAHSIHHAEGGRAVGAGGQTFWVSVEPVIGKTLSHL